MLQVLSWLILGLAAGFLARKIMPGKEPGGLIITILLGIGGAVVGGYIGTLFGFEKVDGFSWLNLIISTVGALILIFAYNKLKNKGTQDNG
ncbi:MAG: GlsB/YeaQ/YmgE family stress response membrane protein [Bacteroidia bacterium]|nr:GlsB/YeaQ/YmgE family stress response membrane protein [Bacteroidia bacterium]